MQKLTGTVIFFIPSKGFGFIKPDDGSNDLFVHYSDIIAEGFKNLKKNDRVSFEVGLNKRNQNKAINVELF